MPKADTVIGGDAAGWEPGARCGPASESCTQAASAGSMSHVLQLERDAVEVAEDQQISRSLVGGHVLRAQHLVLPAHRGGRVHVVGHAVEQRVGALLIAAVIDQRPDRRDRQVAGLALGGLITETRVPGLIVHFPGAYVLLFSGLVLGLMAGWKGVQALRQRARLD